MSLTNIFRRNPIKNLDQKKLKEAEVTLRVRSKELLEEVARIENEIKRLFEKSKEAGSRLNEITIANRIKTLTQKGKMKSMAQSSVEKELTAVTNLLIVKEHEADLKTAGTWELLQKVPSEQLEEHLAGLQLEKQDGESRAKTITDMTFAAFQPSDEQEEDVEEILKVMHAIKEGKLEPEAAKEIVTKKVEEE